MSPDSGLAAGRHAQQDPAPTLSPPGRTRVLRALVRFLSESVAHGLSPALPSRRRLCADGPAVGGFVGQSLCVILNDSAGKTLIVLRNLVN